MAYMIAQYVHLDGTRVTDEIIGVGGTGLVVRRGPHAVKIPKMSHVLEMDGKPVSPDFNILKEGDYDVRPGISKQFENEKAIYRRLGQHSGIVCCHNISSADQSIQMDLMKIDLAHYLHELRPDGTFHERNRPDKTTQLAWLTTLAHTLDYVHSRRVIMADIRSDNFVLDEQLNIKFIDFSESTLMPLDWNLSGSDVDGFSIMTDIGQFGAVMFELITGQRCGYDLLHDWKDVGDLMSCPPRELLPSTSDVWLGHIINKCWVQGYRSAKDLAVDLEKERQDFAKIGHESTDVPSAVCNTVHIEHVAALE